MLEHKRARRARSRAAKPLHQTPSRRIALLFVARARDSKVSLHAGWIKTKTDNPLFRKGARAPTAHTPFCRGKETGLDTTARSSQDNKQCYENGAFFF